MELKVVAENGVRKFDMTVAQRNVDKYSTEKCGLESALERTKFELGNAERILTIVERLSNCWLNQNKPERYFFFLGDGAPALPEELAPHGLMYTEGYRITSLDRVRKVKCPGCTEMRELIGCYIESRPNNPDLFVICGNSVHKV